MNSRARVRIGLLLQGSGPGNGTPRASVLTQAIIDRLVDREALVDLIVPENRPLDIADIRAQHDLYVLKSETPLALNVAGALTLTGATIVNTFRSSNLTRDKLAAIAVLAAAGVPGRRDRDPGRARVQAEQAVA